MSRSPHGLHRHSWRSWKEYLPLDGGGGEGLDFLLSLIWQHSVKKWKQVLYYFCIPWNSRMSIALLGRETCYFKVRSSTDLLWYWNDKNLECLSILYTSINVSVFLSLLLQAWVRVEFKYIDGLAYIDISCFAWQSSFSLYLKLCR